MDAGNSTTNATSTSAGGDAVSLVELDRQLERILASQAFAKSRRLQDFLRYIADRIKTRRGDTIKEYLLAVDVFGRKPTFDPRFDSIVRVQASRLREKLEQYYGRVVGTDSLPQPILPVSVTVGGQPATVLYAGAAPFEVEGVLQINIQLPPGVTGMKVPVTMTVGSAAGQSGVTVAIR
jgi:hypothetical protein